MLISSKSHTAALEQLREQLEKHLTEQSERISKFEEQNKETIASLTSEITAIRKHLSGLEKQQLNVMRPLQDELERVERLGNKLERTINSFQVLRDKASTKLLEETKREITTQLASLTESTADYKRVSAELKTLRAQLDLTTQKLNRFNEQKAKKMDTTSFTRELAKREKEAMQLVRENERLKGMIGRERRRRPSNRPRHRNRPRQKPPDHTPKQKA